MYPDSLFVSGGAVVQWLARLPYGECGREFKSHLATGSLPNVREQRQSGSGDAGV